MVSVDIKTNVSQQEMKELVSVSFNFHRSTFSKLETYTSKTCFLLNLGWHSIQVDIDH